MSAAATSVDQFQRKKAAADADMSTINDITVIIWWIYITY